MATIPSYNDASDFWRWIEISKTLSASDNGTYELDKVQDTIVAAKDAGLAYYCAEAYSHRRNRMQEVVLKSQSPRYLFMFASLPNADIKTLQKTLFATKDLKWISRFACNISGASVKKIINLVANSNNPYCAHMLIKHISNVDPANLVKLKKIILKSRKGRYCYELAKHLTSRREVAKIEDILISENSWTYVRLLAQNHPLASIKKLEQAVIDSGNTKEVKKFAKTVKGSKLQQLSVLL